MLVWKLGRMGTQNEVGVKKGFKRIDLRCLAILFLVILKLIFYSILQTEGLKRLITETCYPKKLPFYSSH